MTTNNSDRDKHPVPTRRIDGPIAEYDQYDRYTGYDYYRCRACGTEAMRRIDLEGCCNGA